MVLRGITNLYDIQQTPEGEKEILVKRNASFIINCEPYDLGPSIELLNIRTGKPYKDRCQVHIRELGVVTVKLSLTKLKELKNTHESGFKIKGFYAGKGNS